MSYKKIKQIEKLVMALNPVPRNLRFVNAYIDQALMNFSYETMTKAQQRGVLLSIRRMIDRFNKIRGR